MSVSPKQPISIPAINRSDLIDQLAQVFSQYEMRDVDFAIREIFNEMARALAEGKRIELRGFGSFSVHRRAPRIARNPRSGESVKVGEKFTPHFKPGRILRQRVINTDGSEAATAPASSKKSSASLNAEALSDSDE